MSDVAVLTRNIETLRGTLSVDMATFLATTSQSERNALRASVETCTLELQRLLYCLITQPLEASDAFRVEARQMLATARPA